MCLTIYISGCSRSLRIEDTPDIVMQCGDPALLNETEFPAPPEPTNEGLIDYILQLQEALNRCNADKAAFRSLIREPEE